MDVGTAVAGQDVSLTPFAVDPRREFGKIPGASSPALDSAAQGPDAPGVLEAADIVGDDHRDSPSCRRRR